LKQHSETLAAVVIEPLLQAAAGMVTHPPGFLRGVRDLTLQYNVLMIADEVAVGMGRTGKMFACEHEGARPDFLCLAKGLTGGYLPLAATLTTDRVWQAFLGPPEAGRAFYHGHTYTGNPLGCAAALATLRLLADGSIVAGVERKARVLREALAPVALHKNVGEIRQKGLMCGVELVADRGTKSCFPPGDRVGNGICLALRGRGIFLRPLGDVIVLMPPLSATEEELRHLATALHAALVDKLGG
jgi:adenosylmethionine-8-amino-7-oxononanoate aminotransferase